MSKRQMIAITFAAAAVLPGGAGAVAADNRIAALAPHGPAVVNDEPATGPGAPDATDLPQPGDAPDGSGH
jgi:hypothetical protein